MDVSMQSTFKEVLERERIRLTSEISRLSGDANHVDSDRLGYGNHMADDATEAFEQAKDAAWLRHIRDVLDDIEDALLRMHRGIYGICESCGHPIGNDRLEILPYARLCMNCQKNLKGNSDTDEPPLSD